MTSSPLGLTDKSDGSKRRIHHLSFPANDSLSINSGIPEEYGTIVYSRISEAISSIQRLGRGSILVKRDFENAFRHIPISPAESPLLGLEWQGRYYAEHFLPFGLGTPAYLFNLFAAVFHCIVAHDLQSRGIRGEIVHYLDDFLAILPPHGNPDAYGKRFAELCGTVGLSIKESISEEGTTVGVGGVEIDTGKIVIRVPAKKLWKAGAIIQLASNQNSLSQPELQALTGYLNFAAILTPRGRTFLRRLYNMKIYFPARGPQCRRRLSMEV